jgi:diguanylate cyclase
MAIAPFRWLLGKTPARRARVAQQLNAVALGASATAVFLLGVDFGQAPRWWVALLLGGAGGLALIGYLLVRSGWSERLEDPSLASLQIGVCMLLGCGAYPLLGEYRSLVIPLMVLVLAFGLFPLQGKAGLKFGATSLLGLLLASGVGLLVWPGTWSLRDELLHLLTAAIALLGMGVVADRVRRVRLRLVEQRTALKEALQRIELLARTDALTGLANRGGGEVMLGAALARHARSGSSLQLALLDIDHFKRLNDTHGHAAGDAVLRHFALHLRACLRGTDAIARWGGEEFLVLMDEVTTEQAQTALERALELLATQAAHHDGVQLDYRFSAGLTQVELVDSAEQALERADRALYAAKHAGRARVHASMAA